MKKILKNITLAAATILLLGSCAKINERIDELEGRINGLEKESIASINTQIESINSSIADLGTIRTNIQNLTSTTAAQAQDIKDLDNEDTEIGKKISDLKKADESINTRIDNLQKYVNDTLKAYATTEWVNATFSTLAQYEATCDTIAKIDARIGSMDTRLSKSIEDCADSLKSWVNVQLDGYYTIAQMDAKVAEMNAQIDTLSSTSAATADSLKAEIAAAKAEIDTVKANIRAEYKSAIETAITELDGKLSNELQTKISQVNSSLIYLDNRISSLAQSVLALSGRVDALEAMIQSVVIVPAYSDGSVKVDNDSLYIDCIVSPDTVVKNIKKDSISILINKVKTKAFAGVGTVKLGNGDIFERDETNGTFSIRVNIENQIPSADDSTITVAVNVKNGKSDYTTDFVPLTIPVSVKLSKNSIVVNSLESPKDTTLTATVKYAKTKSVNWTSTNHGVAAVDNQGKVTIAANKLGKDTVVVKAVEGNATDTCFITVLPQGALAGEFSVSATKKVHFSKGNLVATIDATGTPTAWKFAANQYDYIGSATANTSIGSTAGDVDLFGWSTASTTYGISTSTSSSSYSGDFVDWGKAYCEKNSITPDNTWRTLTTAEWQYLFNTRTASTVSGTENARYAKATVNSKEGVILLPDTYAHPEGVTLLTSINTTGAAYTANTYDLTNWEKMESAGAVFLPSAGYRDGSDVDYVYVGDIGYYWSSTANVSDSAYIVYFASGLVDPGLYDSRNYGYSVRLITESK